METIKHIHAIAVLKGLYAVEDVYSSCVRQTVVVEGGGKIHCHHAVLVVFIISAQRVGQRVAVCSVHMIQRIIWVQDLIHYRFGYLMQVVNKVREVILHAVS